MRTLIKALLGIHQLYFSIVGGKVECNICHYKANRLKTDSWHLYSICPQCTSSMRQRLLWASLSLLNEVNINKIIKGKRVLHFAPDPGISELLRKVAGKYETADFMAEGYSYAHIDHILDISDLKSIVDKSYDCVIACDVLEHVLQHLKAISEVHRILRDSGYAIFTVPQKDHLKKTYEDLGPMDPKEREAKFGQWDHWRIYGNDFTDMLKNASFDVLVVDEKFFDEETVRKYVLFPPVLSKHPLATNYRKIFFAKKI